MANEGIIILIVGIGAVGLAYFSNMLCQPFQLCWPPSAVAQLETEPITERETAKGFIPKYTEAISKELGLGGAIPTIDPTKGAVPVGTSGITLAQHQAVLKAAGITPKARAGPQTPANKRCEPFRSVAPGTYAACMKANASNFAEAESYYVRVA
jgi:hypothetical protein